MATELQSTEEKNVRDSLRGLQQTLQELQTSCILVSYTSNLIYNGPAKIVDRK